MSKGVIQFLDEKRNSKFVFNFVLKSGSKLWTPKNSFGKINVFHYKNDLVFVFPEYRLTIWKMVGKLNLPLGAKVSTNNTIKGKWEPPT